MGGGSTKTSTKTEEKRPEPQAVDVAHLGEDELRELVGLLQDQLRSQGAELDRLRRLLFGRRSEKSKFTAGPDLLPFAEYEDLKDELAEAREEARQVEVPAHTRRVNKRRAEFPEHLPRERVEHVLSEEERACPDCQQTRAEIGEDVTRELERLEICFVREIARKKYACRRCQGHVIQAPAPGRVLEKCLLGPALLAQVAFDRFANHLPYARLERKYAVEGVDLSRNVLCSSMARLAELLEPVFAEHKKEILGALESSVLQVDDTEVLQRNGPKSGGRKIHVWAWRDQDGGVFFTSTATRNRDGPQGMLGDRGGRLQGDGHDCYRGLGEGVVVAGCWAHARRYFETALKGGNELAREPFEWINKLFQVEREAKKLEIHEKEEQLLAHRAAKSVPILQALDAWLEDAALRQIDLPKSPLMEAVGYCRNQWQALTRFATDGCFREISNNGCERALRNLVLGRKNWMFFGSEDGTKTGLRLLSLIQSCRELGVNPLAYLHDVMRRVRDTSPERMHELTPRGWSNAEGQEAQLAASRDELGELVARLQFQG